MDNQHKQIKGYRDLSQEEIDLMNKIKMISIEVGTLVEEVIEYTSNQYGGMSEEEFDNATEEWLDTLSEACQWADKAKKDLQLGFMQLTRAVAKPTTF